MRNLKAYSANYVQHHFEDTQVMYRKKNILESIGNYEHNNILEVGCGLDPFYNCFDDFDKLVIIEPSLPFYNHAKGQISKNKNLKDRVILINDFLENSINEVTQFNFDYILLSCLLPELEDVSLFLDKLRGIMKKHTIVYVNVPNAYSFHRLLAVEMGLIKSVFEVSKTNLLFQQSKVYDRTSLSDLIAKHDYKILNSGSYFVKPFTHGQMAEMIEYNIIDERVIEGLNRMTKYIPDLGSEIFLEFKMNG